MKKILIISEKPSVGMDIAKTLGVKGKHDGYIENDKYIISWAIGHLIEMAYPETYDLNLKKWSPETLPFIPEDYLYQVKKDVKHQFEILKKLLNRKDISQIVNFGDSGVEGEYIQRLIYYMAGYNGEATLVRAWTDSYTDEAILRSIKNARLNSEYDGYMRAGFERAIADYLIGINFSRAETLRYQNLLQRINAGNKETKAPSPIIPVGRVMSCTLAMVVEREQNIRRFKIMPYYGIALSLPSVSPLIKAKWKFLDGDGSDVYHKYENAGFWQKNDAEAYADTLKEMASGKASVRLEQKNEKEYAPYLYNLTDLQKDCSALFKIRPDETLEIAQELYEAKLTTYPRTDARVISKAVAKEILKNLEGLKGISNLKSVVEEIIQKELYKNIARTRYVDDKKIKDHYAIIPTGQAIEKLSGLGEIHQKVYNLIAERFLQIFYPPAEFGCIKAFFMEGTALFVQTGKKLIRPGYRDAFKKECSDSNEEVYQALASLKQDVLYDATLIITDHKTSPPARYTSGHLVAEMETAGKKVADASLKAEIYDGIGTPATRAEIIAKLVKVGHIRIEKKTQLITPTKLGEYIYTILKETCPLILKVDMTAAWQKGLTRIKENKMDAVEYRKKMEVFINKYCNQILKEDHSLKIDELLKQIDDVYK